MLYGFVLTQVLGLMGKRSARILLAILLHSDTGFGVMYTRSVRFLPSDTHLAILLHSETDFVLRYTRPANILLSDTHSGILLRSGTVFLSNVHMFS